MNVLLCSDNQILSDLMARNLVHRGYDVHQHALPPSDVPRAVQKADADLVIVDLDHQEPELWQRASHVRAALPGVPLLILGHAWPTSLHLDQLQPCTYVRKPFAIDTLLAAVQHVPAKARSRG